MMPRILKEVAKQIAYRWQVFVLVFEIHQDVNIKRWR